MDANYRIVKFWKKYFPQQRCKHVVTAGKGDIQPIHDWIYFKDSRGNDMGFKTYEEALNVCFKAEETEKFEEIIEIEINHGKVIETKKIR